MATYIPCDDNGTVWESLELDMEEAPENWRWNAVDPTTVPTRKTNVERTASRLSPLSRMARWIGLDEKFTKTVRHVDSDLRQTCSECALPYVVIEESMQHEDSKFGPKPIRYTNAMVQSFKHKAWGCKLIRYPDDEGTDFSKPVREFKLIEGGTKVVLHGFDMPWSLILVILENLHLWHQRNECNHETNADVIQY